MMVSIDGEQAVCNFQTLTPGGGIKLRHLQYSHTTKLHSKSNFE